MTRFTFATAALAIMLTGALDGQDAPLTIRAGLLLDGTGEQSESVRIFIEDGRIARIDRLRGAVTHDLSGLTIMPGLIDTHVHLASHFDQDGMVHRASSDHTEAETMLYAVGNAQRTLEAGFTTVQSLGDRLDALLRDHIAEGRIWGPRILTSLEPVTAETGDPEAIRRFVRTLADDGADVVKIFASTSIREGGLRALDDAQIEAACEEATAQGLRTAVHAYGTEVVVAVARAGCTSIEHGTTYDETAIPVLVDEGTYLDPHIGLLYDNYFENRDAFFGIGNYTAVGFARMEEARRTGLDTFRTTRLNPEVKIVFGTDAVAGAHGFNADELVARVQDGRQQPMDAIVSATSRAADSLGLGDQIGRVAEGYVADLVAVEGNPLDDIEAIRNVRWVMKDGRVFRNDLELAPQERPRRR